MYILCQNGLCVLNLDLKEVEYFKIFEAGDGEKIWILDVSLKNANRSVLIDKYSTEEEAKSGLKLLAHHIKWSSTLCDLCEINEESNEK